MCQSEPLPVFLYLSLRTSIFHFECFDLLILGGKEGGGGGGGV